MNSVLGKVSLATVGGPYVAHTIAEVVRRILVKVKGLLQVARREHLCRAVDQCT